MIYRAPLVPWTLSRLICSYHIGVQSDSFVQHSEPTFL